MRLLFITLFLITISSLAQNELIYYHNDTIIGKTTIDDNTERYYDWKDSLLFKCVKDNTTWYYYKLDTLYQKIEFYGNGHAYFHLYKGEWVESIRCEAIGLPTIIKNNKADIIINSNFGVVNIVTDKKISSIKVYDVSGRMIKVIRPNSLFITFRTKENIIIINADGISYKHVVR